MSEKERSWIQQKLQTPCYRSSMLYGITSGIGVGLTYFLFTSRGKKASHIGMASYVCVTLNSWFYCHYKMAQREVHEKIFKKAYEQKILKEGTMADPQQWQDLPPGSACEPGSVCGPILDKESAKKTDNAPVDSQRMDKPSKSHR